MDIIMPTISAHYLTEEIIYYLDKLGLPLRFLGIGLQILHFILFLLYFYLILYINNSNISWILLMTGLFIGATQVYFQGCIVSLLEKKLIGGNKTIFSYIFDYQRRLTGSQDNDTLLSLKWVIAGILILLFFIFSNK